MRVLVIGDVVARPGRVAVLERIEDLREQHSVDLAVMNAENLAGGFSVTASMCEELFASGIDVMTSGNHIFDKREAADYIARRPRLLRPANYPASAPGSGVWVGEVRGARAAVINLMGRLYMPPTHDNPFEAADRLISRLGEDVRVRVVDMHAEATSEKVAMGLHLDGRVSAVVGTHTHVQTADERVLARGTAYITDVGMTGSHSGCIGMEGEGAVARFLNPAAPRAEHSKGDVRINAVVIDVDDSTGRAREISRLSLPHES